MTRPDPPAAPAVARVDRVVVHAPGDAATGTRLADRLPGAIAAAVRDAGAADALALRAAIADGVREAAR
jgi:hypothetical protein